MIKVRLNEGFIDVQFLFLFFKFQFPYAVLSCYFTFIDGVCIFLMR